MKEYFKMIKRYRMASRMALFLLLAAMWSIITTMQIKALQMLIDGLSDIANLIPYFVCLAIAFVNRDLYYRVKGKLVEDVSHAYRTDMFGKILHLSINDLNDTSVGKMITAVQSAYEVVGNMVDLPQYFLTITISATTAMILMFQENHVLTVIILLELLPVAFVIPFFRNQVKTCTEERRESSTKLNESIARLEHFLLIKSFGKEQFEYDRNFKESVNFKSIAMKKKYASYRMANLFRFIFYAVEITIIVYSYIAYKNGAPITAGQVVMFIDLSWRLMDPLDAIPSTIDSIVSVMVNVKSNNELLEKEEEFDNDIELTSFNNSIVFDNVNFAYNDSDTILKDISLEIKKGMKVGIYGESGAGKSSLVNLLMRFFTLGNGRILVDGININEFRSKSLRRKIGIVNQDIHIFSDMTVKENIAYGVSGCTDAEIAEAAKKANCHDFIMKLANGYDSRVGNDGVKLSGGERQRISLARLFLLNPDILILDEATSKLDNASEDLIKESIEKLAKDKTVISIAHRFTTIEDSDLLVGIKDHVIYETGTKETLNKEGTLFNKLYR